jgi:hypothetical protein
LPLFNQLATPSGKTQSATKGQHHINSLLFPINTKNRNHQIKSSGNHGKKIFKKKPPGHFSPSFTITPINHLSSGGEFQLD